MFGSAVRSSNSFLCNPQSATARIVDMGQKPAAAPVLSLLTAIRRSMPMSVQDHSGHQGQPREGISLKSRVGLVLVAFLVVAGALLFTEHRAHVLGLLIWLPLLACPLMHIFMHGRSE